MAVIAQLLIPGLDAPRAPVRPFVGSRSRARAVTLLTGRRPPEGLLLAGKGSVYDATAAPSTVECR
jgi:hypothetical protein